MTSQDDKGASLENEKPAGKSPVSTQPIKPEWRERIIRKLSDKGKDTERSRLAVAIGCILAFGLLLVLVIGIPYGLGRVFFNPKPTPSPIPLPTQAPVLAAGPSAPTKMESGLLYPEEWSRLQAEKQEIKQAWWAFDQRNKAKEDQLIGIAQTLFVQNNDRERHIDSRYDRIQEGALAIAGTSIAPRAQRQQSVDPCVRYTGTYLYDPCRVLPPPPRDP